MKTVKITLFMVMLAAVTMAQGVSKIPLLGEKAPNFRSNSTQGVINFPEDFGNNWKLLLSHPKDFTPVCTSELLALASMQDDFKDLGVDIVVVSTDTLYMHHSWIKAMEGIEFDDRESVKINFPLVDDNNTNISRKYGMMHEHTSTTKNVRGVYVVDPDNIIRLLQFYPMEVGRNMDEIKRSIIALQTSMADLVYTPANWNPGDDVIIYRYNKETLANPDVYQKAWFLTYKKTNTNKQ